MKNQDIILNSMEGVQKNQENYVDYFKPLAYGEVETENLVAEDVNKDKEQRFISVKILTRKLLFAIALPLEQI